MLNLLGKCWFPNYKNAFRNFTIYRLQNENILVFPNNFRIEFLILDHCALGGSTSPDETSQRQNNLADSSFSDEREENFESYGENGDVEYEA